MNRKAVAKELLSLARELVSGGADGSFEWIRKGSIMSGETTGMTLNWSSSRLPVNAIKKQAEGALRKLKSKLKVKFRVGQMKSGTFHPSLEKGVSVDVTFSKPIDGLEASSVGSALKSLGITLSRGGQKLR